MLRLLILIAPILVFSCNEKTVSNQFPASAEKRNILEDFSFSIDTMMVDTGGDLINFGIPFIGAQSSDAKFYHILNYKTLYLQKIDLDSLKLVDTFRFEKDGPNSPGFTFSFQPVSNEHYFFPNFQKPSIIHKSGEKTRSWNLNPNDIIDGFPVEPGSVTNRVVFNPSLDELYSLPTNYETREYYFAILDSVGERKHMLELPEFLKADQFTIRTGEGEGGGLKIELPFLQHVNDLVLISCTVGNGIYIFDLTQDSLFYREFPHKLVPLGKEGVVKNRVHSNEEFEEEIKKLATQISYWSFIWDEHSQRYYRFASRVVTHQTEYNEVEMEIFLMVFSKDLELLGETKVEGLPKVPLGAFFKDGKLWNYVNVEDELGFVVMDLNFEK